MKLKKKVRLKLLIMLVCSIVLVCGSGITYSLFTSDTKLVANQKIAKFVFDTKKTDLIELPITDLNPGDNVDYTFQVANTIENAKSQVTIKYQMIIKTYHFMPLNIELYKIVDDKEELVIKCDETYSRDENNQIICNTATQKMDHNLKVSDNYKLKISFPEEYNSEIYTELVDYIDIEIKSWQSTGE